MRNLRFIKVKNSLLEAYDVFYNKEQKPIGQIVKKNMNNNIWEIKQNFTILVEHRNHRIKEFYDMSKAGNALADLYEFMGDWEMSMYSF